MLLQFNIRGHGHGLEQARGGIEIGGAIGGGTGIEDEAQVVGVDEGQSLVLLEGVGVMASLVIMPGRGRGRGGGTGIETQNRQKGEGLQRSRRGEPRGPGAFGQEHFQE